MSEEEKKDEQPQTEAPKWERREFAINAKMKEVLKLSAKATEAEISALRKKLRKLQYGA